MKEKQNLVLLIVLCLVIIVTLCFIVKTVVPERAPKILVNWICDSCGYSFVAKFQPGPIKCRKCEKIEAVRTILYECKKCGKIFEAYRTKPDLKRKPMMLFKAPGGEWIGEPSSEALRLQTELSCRYCRNTDKGMLKPYSR